MNLKMPPPPPPPPNLLSAPPPPPPPSSNPVRARSDLLKSIEKGTRLKKTETNDRSAPVVASNRSAPPSSSSSSSNTNASSSGVNYGRLPGISGLFSDGIPKLKPTQGGIQTGRTPDTSSSHSSPSNRNYFGSGLRSTNGSSTSSIASEKRNFQNFVGNSSITNSFSTSSLGISSQRDYYDRKHSVPYDGLRHTGRKLSDDEEVLFYNNYNNNIINNHVHEVAVEGKRVVLELHRPPSKSLVLNHTSPPKPPEKPAFLLPKPPVSEKPVLRHTNSTPSLSSSSPQPPPPSIAKPSAKINIVPSKPGAPPPPPPPSSQKPRPLNAPPPPPPSSNNKIPNRAKSFNTGSRNNARSKYTERRSSKDDLQLAEVPKNPPPTPPMRITPINPNNNNKPPTARRPGPPPPPPPSGGTQLNRSGKNMKPPNQPPPPPPPTNTIPISNPPPPPHRSLPHVPSSLSQGKPGGHLSNEYKPDSTPFKREALRNSGIHQNIINGSVDLSAQSFEERLASMFMPMSSLPPPEPFTNCQKTYPSRSNQPGASRTNNVIKRAPAPPPPPPLSNRDYIPSGNTHLQLSDAKMWANSSSRC